MKPQRSISQETDPENGTRLQFRYLSDVVPKPIDWIWPRWLARGKLHLLGGIGGIGKGTICGELAAQLSTGKGSLPDGSPAPHVKTLFLLSEDDVADTLSPRLDLHGAAKDNIGAVDAVTDAKGRLTMVDLHKHILVLETTVEDQGFGLLVIDALSDFMTGVDRNSEGEVRDVLTPLSQMAQRTNVAIIGVVHPGKGNQELRGFQRILGASAFGNMARSVWIACESPDGNSRKLLGVDKSNLAMKPPTLEWSRDEDQPIIWHGVSRLNISEAFGATTAKPRDDAEGFLRELLKDGPVESSRVQAVAKAAGFHGHTVRRAADDMGVERFRPSGQKNPPWFWRLPTTPSGGGGDESGDEVDDLPTPLHAHVGNTSSRHQEERLAHPSQMWATREKPQNNGKMPTERDGGQHVPPTVDDLPTNGRLDDLPTLEPRAVGNTSEGSSNQWPCVVCRVLLVDGPYATCPDCKAKVTVPPDVEDEPDEVDADGNLIDVPF